jgi:hypothetical protein
MAWLLDVLYRHCRWLWRLVVASIPVPDDRGSWR